MKIRSSTTRSTIFEMEVPNYENRKTSEKGDFREMLRICSHWKIAKTNPNVNEDPNFSLMFAVIKVTLDVLRIHLLLSQSLSLLHESNLLYRLEKYKKYARPKHLFRFINGFPSASQCCCFFFFWYSSSLLFVLMCPSPFSWEMGGCGHVWVFGLYIGVLTGTSMDTMQ